MSESDNMIYNMSVRRRAATIAARARGESWRLRQKQPRAIADPPIDCKSRRQGLTNDSGRKEATRATWSYGRLSHLSPLSCAPPRSGCFECFDPRDFALVFRASTLDSLPA